MDQSSHLEIYVRIKREAAILHNSTLVGLCRIPFSAEWLASLTERERKILATLEPFEERYALQDDRLIPTPTLQNVVLYLREEIKAVEVKERKAQEELARKDQEAIPVLAEWFDKSDDDRVYRTHDGKYTVDTPLSRVYYHGEINKHLDRLRASNPEVMQQYDAVIERLKQHANERYKQDREAERKAKERREEMERKRLAEEERKREKKRAAQKAYEDERTEWVRQHGSERLRALLDEDLGLDRTYRNERLQAEFPGFEWYQQICGTLRKAANVSLEDINRMRALRKRYPEHDVQLQWLADGEHRDGCEHEEDWDGGGTPFEPRAVVTARFLGETIVRD